MSQEKYSKTLAKQKPASVSTLNGPNAKNMVRQKASMYHRIGLFNKHQHRILNKAKTPSQVAYAQSPSQHPIDLLDPLFVTKKLGGACNAVETSSGSKSRQVLTGAWKGLKEVGLDIQFFLRTLRRKLYFRACK